MAPSSRGGGQPNADSADAEPSGHHHQLMSPSHNSDGLSSGQSFASSSPASSPVCSNDSSSGSAGQTGNGGNSSNSSSASSSVASSSGFASSQLYANSIDWNHFLADHHNQQLALRAAAAAATSTTRTAGSNGHHHHQHHHHDHHHLNKQHWLPNQRQHQQIYHASTRGQELQLAEPNARARQNGKQSNRRSYTKTPKTSATTINPPSISDACFLLSPPSSEPETATSSSSSSTAAATAAAAAVTKNHLNSKGNSNQNGPLQFSMQLTACSPGGAGNNSGGAPYRQRQQRQTAAAGRNYQHLAKAGYTVISPTSSPSSSSAAPAQPRQRAAAASLTGAKRGRKPNALKLQLQQQKLTSQSSGAADLSGTKPSISSQTTTVGKQRQQQQQSNLTSQQFFHHQSTSSSASNQQQAESGRNQCSSKLTGDSNSNQLDSHQLPHGSYLINGSTAVLDGGGAAPLPASMSLSMSRRVRNENRKCRKVYGMERRDLWCTQCKWKKACSRFCDQ